MPEIKIAILLDSANSWIDKYIRQLKTDYKLDVKYSFFFSYDPDDIKHFDIVFILGYTKILDKSFLDSNALTLLVHESDLPKGKGFSPVQWQVLEGKRIIPVCLIEATKKVDSGDIFETSIIELSGYELFPEIREKQAFATIEVIKRFLVKYPDNMRIKQIGEETYYRRRNMSDDALDIDKTIREQFNHFRIANNDEYPLYFIIDGHKYYLKIYSNE